MNILLLDIETAPSIAYVWRFFKENIGAKQVKEHSTILSYAAKWLGEDKVFYEDVSKQKEKSILRKLNKLLDKADFIVAHNGQRFDMRKIRGRALVLGLKPTSPYRVIDTCLIARREFGFESNSLEYLANVLELTPKSSHRKFPGFELWLEVLRNNPEAWAEMKSYNIQDIQTLEELYLFIRAYDRSHPNTVVALESEEVLCPVCGHDEHYKDGFAHTNFGVYPKFQCKGCGKYHRGRTPVNSVASRKSLTANAK